MGDRLIIREVGRNDGASSQTDLDLDVRGGRQADRTDRPTEVGGQAASGRVRERERRRERRGERKQRRREATKEWERERESSGETKRH